MLFIGDIKFLKSRSVLVVHTSRKNFHMMTTSFYSLKIVVIIIEKACI